MAAGVQVKDKCPWGRGDGMEEERKWSDLGYVLD